MAGRVLAQHHLCSLVDTSGSNEQITFILSLSHSVKTIVCVFNFLSVFQFMHQRMHVSPLCESPAVLRWGLVSATKAVTCCSVLQSDLWSCGITAIEMAEGAPRK